MSSTVPGHSGWLGQLLGGRRRGAQVFISYRRRGDSAGFAARLADRLVAHFGENQCFRDIEDIESGTDFVQGIQDALDSCRALIVVIGTDWVTVEDGSGRRRLDNPDDFVRIEVATALRKDVRVIPVLVAGAQMPAADELPDDLRPLTRRQAHELSDLRWDYDVGQLLAALERLGVPTAARQRSQGLSAIPARMKKGAAVVATGMVLVSAVALGMNLAAPEGAFDPSLTGEYTDPGVDGPAAETASLPESGVVETAVPSATVEEKASQPLGRPVTEAPRRTEPDRAAEPERTAEPVDPVAPYRAGLRQAVEQASQAEAESRATLDGSQLVYHYEGAALEAQVAELAQMAMAGLASDNELEQQRIVDVRVNPGAQLAEVDLVEEWSVEFINVATGLCVARVLSHEVPQTLHLRRAGDRWLIYQVEFHDAVSPDPVPC